MQMQNYNEILKKFEEDLNKRTERLAYEYSIIRAGRANPKMLDKILVDYYGTPTPINQMANISVPEARLIVISPWDISQVKEINKAIIASDIGVHPNDDGRLIRLAFPPVTEEKRKEIVKDVKKLCEEAKVNIRADRRDVLEVYKKAQKDKQLSEDELKGAETAVQKIVDKVNAHADSMCANKEKEVLEI